MGAITQNRAASICEKASAAHDAVTAIDDWIAGYAHAGRLAHLRQFEGDVASAIALYVSFVTLIVAVLLQHLINLGGRALVADWILHYVTPALFVVYWLIFVPKRSLRWKHPLVWASYPLAYLIYALFRGGLSGFYPYPFIDVAVLGLPRVFLNGAALLVVFCLAGLLLVLIDRRWPFGPSKASIRTTLDS